MNVASSGAVDSSTSLYAWNYWNPATFGPDAEAYATIARYGAADIIRIGGRVTGAGTTGYSGYFVSVNSSGVWSILRIDNGTPVTLSSASSPLATGGPNRNPHRRLSDHRLPLHDRRRLDVRPQLRHQ